MRRHTALTKLTRVALVGLLVSLAGLTGTPASASPTAAPPTPAASAPPAPQPASPPTTGQEQPLIIVLDTSGSMKDNDGTGVIKIDGAKNAVLDVITAASGAREFGFLNYPDNSASKVADCQPGRIQVPLGPLNTSQAMSAVRSIIPDGETSTSNALRQAAAMLSARGYSSGTIVLVSDGESNCGPPPCDVAKELTDSGKSVVVNTVGFQLTSQVGRDELSCIAKTTSGTNVTVQDTNELVAAIKNASEPSFTLAHTIPPVIPTVTSAASGAGITPENAGSPISVEVRNTSAVMAKDTRVSLSFSQHQDLPNQPRSKDGNIQVVPPARYLGNLAPGQTRRVDFLIRPIHFSGTANWTLTAMASSGNALQVTGSVGVDADLNRDALGPVLKGVSRVAVLGDSLSAGTGGGDYLDPNSGQSAASCQQSGNGYARQLWGNNAIILACSGASTTDLRQPHQSGGQTVAPQLEQLRNLALSDLPPEAVFLSVGAFDVQYPQLLNNCVLFGNCTNWGKLEPPVGHAEGEDERIIYAQALQPQLAAAYRSIDNAINDPKALAKRNGKVAPIIVLPYPRTLPHRMTNELGLPRECVFSLTNDGATYYNELSDAVNSSIFLATVTMTDEARPVYYASDVLDIFQPDFTLCTLGGPYFDLALKQKYLAGNPNPTPEGWKDFTLYQSLAEQDKLGALTPQAYNLISRTLVGWSQRIEVQPSTATRTWSDKGVGSPSVVDRVKKKASDVFGTTPGNGDYVELSADGFKPGSDVTFWFTPGGSGGGQPAAPKVATAAATASAATASASSPPASAAASSPAAVPTPAVTVTPSLGGVTTSGTTSPAPSATAQPPAGSTPPAPAAPNSPASSTPAPNTPTPGPVDRPSTPAAIPAGHGVADENGHVSITVPIPPDQPSGEATVNAQGFAPDGSAREVSQPLEVGATGSTSNLLVGLAGLILLLLAVVLWLAARVRG